jgi:hypothetical protein
VKGRGRPELRVAGARGPAPLGPPPYSGPHWLGWPRPVVGMSCRLIMGRVFVGYVDIVKKQ